MPRVLVVEDSPTQAQEIAFILEDAGFTVETAPDARRGFECLTHGRFDLVLTDVQMPGDSGFDLCRRIKADPAHRHVPVVVHTSQADPVNVLRGLEAGADGFMTKGREPAEIVGRIHRALAGSREPPAGSGIYRKHVVFLGHAFDLSLERDQLLDVLLSAFEDVVHLDQRRQASEAALHELNQQLAQRNQRLQQLAADLQELALSERQAHQALKAAQSRLVLAEKLAGLGQMVAGVAHEINNPLGFVLNNVAVLQRDVHSLRELIALYQEADPMLAEHQPELLGRIHDLAGAIDLAYTLGSLEELMVRSRDGLKRIQKIVLDLRDFARLDESDLHAVDVNEGIRSTIQFIRRQAEQKQVEIALELSPLPAVTCYPAKINQVVHNLVANAIDASPPGGRVTVRTGSTPDGVEIEVVDCGRGIDPAIRDKVFDPFFTTKPVGEGTGLGLSISYGIVQDHGGTLDFDSAPGRGARFLVRLPLQPRPAGGGP